MVRAYAESFMTVPNSRWDGVSFLHYDMSFSFVSDMRNKVTSVDVDTSKHLRE